MYKWILKTTTTVIKSVTLLMMLALGSLVISIKTPQLQNNFLRKAVGTHVFKVLGTKKNAGGGTGFAIKAKSGKIVVVSNAHVCEAKDKNNLVLLVGTDGKKYYRKVINMSGTTDLCYIDGKDIPGALELGEPPSVGQLVTVVGHPSLDPLTIAHGEIIGQEDVTIPDGMLSDKNGFNRDFEMPTVTLASCSNPKQTRHLQPIPVTEDITIFIAMCFTTTKDAYLSSVHVEPGNSGSPVVDTYGRVVAVVFAKDGFNKGKFVNHKDLKDFLDKL